MSANRIAVSHAGHRADEMARDKSEMAHTTLIVVANALLLKRVTINELAHGQPN